jgi:diadenosine tetraphosphate (Ap4A) HIT family hydrolase
MTPNERKELELIVQRLKRNKAQAGKGNGYNWGLSDGLEIAFDMVEAYLNKFPAEPDAARLPLGRLPSLGDV